MQGMPVPRERDWNEIGARLFRLPECRVEAAGSGGSVGDSGDLRIELFDRGNSRTYFCSGPRSGSPQRPVAPEAVQMYEFLWELNEAALRAAARKEIP